MDKPFLNIKQNLSMSPLQNSYLFANILVKSLPFLLQPQQFNISNHSLTFMYPRQDLQSLHLLLWSPSTRLSARLDSKLNMNLKLSINLILYVTALSFSALLVLKRLCTFLCFLLSIQLPFKFFCQLSDYKMIVIFRTIMKYHKSSFGVLPLRLKILLAVSLYLPLQWQWSCTLYFSLPS